MQTPICKYIRAFLHPNFPTHPKPRGETGLEKYCIIIQDTDWFKLEFFLIKATDTQQPIKERYNNLFNIIHMILPDLGMNY